VRRRRPANAAFERNRANRAHEPPRIPRGTSLAADRKKEVGYAPAGT
jgi:hypothetical protein